MPSSITHSYFMKDVYDKLDDSMLIICMNIMLMIIL